MKRVVLCGLGAVGITFGSKLNDCEKIDLKVVVDRERLLRYELSKPKLNGIEQTFDYILPSENFEDVDLIIIATKAWGLENAILSVKKFTGKNTRIISLINGISSEEIISQAIPHSRVLKSYFIGHSAVRDGNSVTQDGVGRIVVEKDDVLEEILSAAGIDFEFPKDIDYSMWRKFTFNVFSNQSSAILNMTFGELRRNKRFIEFAKKITSEIRLIAEKKGIKNLENLEQDAIGSLNEMCEEGKTSMLQDVLSGRKTEAEIFGGEVIRLGKLYNILTPYNQALYDLVKIKEESF